MITYMQFIDKDIVFGISELNDTNQVHITMSELGQELNELSIELGEIELHRLAVWINESIDTLKRTKSEAP